MKGSEFIDHLLQSPFKMLLFLMIAISSVCGCPLYSVYENVIHRDYPWTAGISWTTYGCVTGLLYIGFFLYLVISFATRKGK